MTSLKACIYIAQGCIPAIILHFDCISKRYSQHQEHLHVSEIVASVEIGVSLAWVRVRTTLSMEVCRPNSGCVKRSIQVLHQQEKLRSSYIYWVWLHITSDNTTFSKHSKNTRWSHLLHPPLRHPSSQSEGTEELILTNHRSHCIIDREEKETCLQVRNNSKYHLVSHKYCCQATWLFLSSDRITQRGRSENVKCPMWERDLGGSQYGKHWEPKDVFS